MQRRRSRGERSTGRSGGARASLAAAWVALGLAAPVGAGAETVYENVAGPSGGIALDPLDELGDEVTLGGSARVVTTFEFLYAGQFDQDGDEMVTLRFYDNDGPGGEPGTLFYDSGPLPIVPVASATVYAVDDIDVEVPETFTCTVDVDGTGAGSDRASLLVADGPPSVGSSDASFIWLCCWAQFGPFATDNFYARIEALPEPAGGLAAGAALIALLARGRRLLRSARAPRSHDIAASSAMPSATPACRPGSGSASIS
jgi:hypothetical protein